MESYHSGKTKPLELIFRTLLLLDVTFFHVHIEQRFVRVRFIAHRARKYNALVDQLVRSVRVWTLEALRAELAGKGFLVRMYPTMCA